MSVKVEGMDNGGLSSYQEKNALTSLRRHRRRLAFRWLAPPAQDHPRQVGSFRPIKSALMGEKPGAMRGAFFFR